MGNPWVFIATFVCWSTPTHELQFKCSDFQRLVAETTQLFVASNMQNVEYQGINMWIKLLVV
jgi:hypothetical protein